MSDDHNELLAGIVANIWTGVHLLLDGPAKWAALAIAILWWVVWVLVVWYRRCLATRKDTHEH